TQLGIKNFFFLNSRKDVRPLLKSIDIYVCSSNNESSPLSVWEAMSMKKAIVSTDVGDVRKFIKNNVNGFIVKVGDSDSLAKAIIKLIKNPKLKHIFGKSVRKVAKNKLDLKICKRLHSEAYQKIIYNV
ncbi:MAG: glycosyltransferase, partial [Gammaproteobacteria bacterium]